MLTRKLKAKKKKFWTGNHHLQSKGEKDVSRENKLIKKYLTKLFMMAPSRREIALHMQYNQSGYKFWN